MQNWQRQPALAGNGFGETQCADLAAGREVKLADASAWPNCPTRIAGASTVTTGAIPGAIGFRMEIPQGRKGRHQRQHPQLTIG
jgi:hypothetical protein